MSKVTIDKEGLKTLINILIGCWTFFIEESENKNYIKICKEAKIIQSSEVDFNRIIAKLHPKMNNSILHQIKDYSYNFGGKITPEVLWDFFSSGTHIERIIQLFKKHNFKLNNPKILEWLFAHTLIPAYLKESNKVEFEAEYQNGDILINLSGLILPNINIEVDLEKPVFVHFATIIDVNCLEEKAQYFLARQSKNKDFTKACRKIEKIDYKKFLSERNLTTYTRKRFTKLKK